MTTLCMISKYQKKLSMHSSCFSSYRKSFCLAWDFQKVLQHITIFFFSATAELYALPYTVNHESINLFNYLLRSITTFEERGSLIPYYDNSALGNYALNPALPFSLYSFSTNYICCLRGGRQIKVVFINFGDNQHNCKIDRQVGGRWEVGIYCFPFQRA